MRTLMRLTPGTDALYCLGVHTDITTKEDFRERFFKWCGSEGYDDRSVDDYLWLEVKDLQEAHKIIDEVDGWDDDSIESFEKRFVTFDEI